MKKNPVLSRKIRAVQKALRIKFNHHHDLIAALTHSSYRNEKFDALGTDFPDYERLEFFGDAILNFAICEKLFKLYPESDEGDLSKLRSILVSKKLLAKIARKLTLGRHLNLAKGQKNLPVSYRQKLLSDALEALIGAIYLDRGLRTIQTFIWRHWAPYFNEKKLLLLDPNPKSTLQEYTQKTYQKLPIYHTAPAKRGFTATVVIQKHLSGKGTGASKREAEAKAAQALLSKLKRTKRYVRFSNRDSKSVIPV